MNKIRIVMASVGGAALLAALAVGWFAWSAWDAKVEADMNADAARGQIATLKNAAVPPTKEAAEAFGENRNTLEAWREEAFELSKHGDTAPERGLTPAALKQRMVDNARELMKLPGGVNGLLVQQDFGFGFGGIVNGRDMPDPGRMDELQRQWAEVMFLARALSAVGAVELVKIAPHGADSFILSSIHAV